MNMRCVLLTLIAFVAFEAITAAEVRYEILPLTFRQPSRINSRGQIVGTSSLSGSARACIWYRGTITDLGAFSGRSYGYGINNAGEVVGYREMPNDQFHAFLWSQGQLVDIAPSIHYSQGNAINDHGQIVGYYDSNGTCGFLFENGIMHDFGTYTSGFDAIDINNAGKMVGYTYRIAYITAFLWQNDQWIYLSNLPGCRGSIADAINERDQIVGNSFSASYVYHACLWENGTIRDLGTLPGGDSSWAWDINNLGQIVGSSHANISGRQVSRAVIWQDGQPIDLNGFLPPGSTWSLGRADGINDNGWIIGTGNLGNRHDFLLRPVLAVSVDVRPGSESNPVNLKSNGVLPVAILTTDDFDATSVDPPTVRFADAPLDHWSNQDVDMDGLTDLLCFFRTSSLNLSESDAHAALRGETVDGQCFEGSDAVTVKGPKSR